MKDKQKLFRYKDKNINNTLGFQWNNNRTIYEAPRKVNPCVVVIGNTYEDTRNCFKDYVEKNYLNKNYNYVMISHEIQTRGLYIVDKIISKNLKTTPKNKQLLDSVKEIILTIKEKMKTDIEKFIELYKSFGVNCVVNKDNTMQYIILHESNHPHETIKLGNRSNFTIGQDKFGAATISKKFGGYSDFFTQIEFDLNGKFIGQYFYE